MATSILGQRVLLLRLERGEVQELRSNALARLANILQVSTDYLLGREQPECRRQGSYRDSL
jgi:transcriptional regulator with XRE-family HTH domain